MPETDVEPTTELRIRRYRTAALLLKKWAADDAVYDERVGDALERELTNDFLRCEERNENPS